MSAMLAPPMHIVTCAELAREREWHAVTALRWLKKLCADRGERFAWRRGREWVTSREVLEFLAEEERGKLIARLEPRVAALEEELAEERRRSDVLAKQVAEFRKMANDWFSSRKR